MRRIYTVSDQHFGHQSMYKFISFDGVTKVRPFDNAENGDAHMIEMHNAVVRPDDHVWHLGDFTCHNLHALQRVAPRLNGHHRIVLGNHDIVDPRHWYNNGFKKVTGMHRLYDVWLTHAPCHPSLFGPKVLGNAHGHIHERPSPPGCYFNVSVERLAFTPIDFEQVRVELRKLKESQLP